MRVDLAVSVRDRERPDRVNASWICSNSAIHERQADSGSIDSKRNNAPVHERTGVLLY